MNRCPECQMILSVDNLFRAAQRSDQEKLCKHGVTHPPIIDERGFLAAGVPH